MALIGSAVFTMELPLDRSMSLFVTWTYECPYGKPLLRSRGEPVAPPQPQLPVSRDQLDFISMVDTLGWRPGASFGLV